MAENLTIQHLYQPQDKLVSIKLEKGQKDTYAWEVKGEGKTVDEALKLVVEADAQLKTIFKQEEVKKNG